MFILIIPSWYPSKENKLSGIFFKEQAEALSRAGHKVIVAYPEMWNILKFPRRFFKQGILVQTENNLDVFRYKGYNYFPKLYNLKKKLFLKRAKKLYRLIEEKHGKPDVIHAHSALYGGYAASVIGKEENIPTVLTEHSSAFSRDIYNRVQIRIIKKTLNDIDKVIAVGIGLKKDIEKIVPNRVIEMIPNMIDTDKFRPLTKNDSYNSFTFFSLGFLDYNKGFDILIKAFKKAKIDNSQLLIGGEGKEKKKLISLRDKLGLQNQVKFLGRLNRKQVLKEMNSCDIFVLASRQETFGVVLIEALACGKPVIATRSGGPEIIVNDNNGLLVPADDIAFLAKAMVRIRKEINQYDSEIIRKICTDNFSREAIVKKIELQYFNLIDKNLL
ncbi:MAG: glycosyltransferase [Halanaerobiales bacterium]|nr:glycosyltransferase [Halanaerobiales bacterium]